MEAARKKISVSTGCYNEEGNLREFYERTKAALAKFPQYDYEIIVADNRSTDGSRAILRDIAAKDKNFKVIFNSNNFGHLRSPYNAFLQTTGDATVAIVSDLQEPPELIEGFVRKWEEGFQVVVGVRKNNAGNPLIALFRVAYYFLVDRISDSPQGVLKNFTGFGLYDRKFMDALRRYNEPMPYLRGLVSEIGFKRAEIEFSQAERKSGSTKNNLFTLYDCAMVGFIHHSKLPLRLATFTGFALAGLSLLASFSYLAYKLLFWNNFSIGMAPLIIGLFFFSAVQLIFIGIVGEYVGAILTQVRSQPLAIEDERLNFD